MKLYVMNGDITHAEVKVIVTAINSSGAWFGRIDQAIYRLAGEQYHDQVIQTGDLKNGDVILATGDHREHRGGFDHVLFVIDDLQSPLSDLIFAVLKMAYEEGLDSVAFPLMRTGVMLGVVEPSMEKVIEEMRLGFERFNEEFSGTLSVFVVVYHNPHAFELLSSFMKPVI